MALPTTHKQKRHMQHLYEIMQDVVKRQKVLPGTTKGRTMIIKIFKKEYPSLSTTAANDLYNSVLDNVKGLIDTQAIVEEVLNDSYLDHESMRDELELIERQGDLDARVNNKTLIMKTRNEIRRNIIDLVTKREKSRCDFAKNDLLKEKLDQERDNNMLTVAMQLDGTLEEKTSRFKQILGKNMILIKDVLNKKVEIIENG
jgi:hypothetical protein